MGRKYDTGGSWLRASHKHKEWKTIVYFWMMKTLADVCVDTGTMKELSDVKCAIDMGKSQRLLI